VKIWGEIWKWGRGRVNVLLSVSRSLIQQRDTVARAWRGFSHEEFTASHPREDLLDPFSSAAKDDARGSTIVDLSSYLPTVCSAMHTLVDR